MSALRNSLDEYLALRRALGFKLERAAHLLPGFVAHLEHHGTPNITTVLALAWAKQPPDGDPAWWAERLSLVRGFAKHMQALDARTEVPAAELLPSRTRRATPYLYSDRDIARLMQAAQRLPHPLRAGTYTALIGLLATTGLRVGEALRLDRQDIDRKYRLLVIRSSKFGKSREVALHDSTLAALLAYARLRDRLLPRPQVPSFFLSIVGTRLRYDNFHITFLGLVCGAGLERRSARCRPRPHDLRHTFAVRTLLDWYRAGDDVEARLPQLSTYLGHFDPSSTYWYLSAAPELLTLVGQRLEKTMGVVP
jgi:integrase/recombinase XerD